MAEAKVKMVAVTAAVNNITVAGVQHNGVMGKKIHVPQTLVATLVHHNFIVGEKHNEPVS